MTLLRYSLREALRRPARLGLTLVGIMIGVGGIVAISTTIRATRQAYREMFANLTGNASLEVTAQGQDGLSADWVARLAGVPGVASAVPVVQAPAALRTARGSSGVLILGIDPKLDPAARRYDFREGRQVAGDDEIVLTTTLAEQSQARLGATIELWTPSGMRRLAVVGIIEPRGAAVFSGGTLAVVALPMSQKMFRLNGLVNSIQLVLQDDASDAQVRAHVAGILPSGLTIDEPAARGTLAQDNLYQTEQGLSSMSMVSIVAGAFVIINAVSMSLGERRKQMAILRSLGATRKQITQMLLVEALVLGLVGTAGGWVCGYFGAMGLEMSLEQLLRIDVPGFQVSGASLLLAALLGPGVTLAATLIPARRAALRPPLADLYGWHDPREEKASARAAILGLALLAAAGATAWLLLAGWIPTRLMPLIGTPLLAFFLVGLMLLIPRMFPYLSTAAGRALRPVWGLEGRLALLQLNRHERRSGLTAGVLIVAVVVGISMGQTLRNNVNDVREWAQANILADFIVRGVMPDAGTMLAAALPESVADELEQLPGVAFVSCLNFVPARVDGRATLILARDVGANPRLELEMAEGDPADVRQRLLAGEVVLGTALAGRLGRKVGDTVELSTRDGPQKLRVAGTATEYTSGGSTLVMNRAQAQQLLGFRGAQAFLVTCRPEAREQSAAAVRAFVEERGLLFQSQSDFLQVIDSMMAGVVGFIWLLMALVFVTASLGIVNTLTMNILEQTREFGVLRSVAMLPSQVRKTVLCQALGLGLIGAVPGAIAGSVLAYLMNIATRPLIGHPVDFRIEPAFVAGCAALAVVTAVAAGCLPARRAARMPIMQALQYE